MWDGQSNMKWYNSPATIALAERFRGWVTIIRNERFSIIPSPTQRQQKRDRNGARKQSSQRHTEERAGENNRLYMQWMVSISLLLLVLTAPKACRKKPWRGDRAEYWQQTILVGPDPQDWGASLIENGRRAGSNRGGKTALGLNTQLQSFTALRPDPSPTDVCCDAGGTTHGLPYCFRSLLLSKEATNPVFLSLPDTSLNCEVFETWTVFCCLY